MASCAPSRNGLSLDSRWVTSDAVVTEPLGDGLAVLDTATGRVFTLSGVAAFAWSRLREGRILRSIADEIADAFETDSATAGHDLLEWAAGMLEYGLASEVTEA